MLNYNLNKLFTLGSLLVVINLTAQDGHVASLTAPSDFHQPLYKRLIFNYILSRLPLQYSPFDSVTSESKPSSLLENELGHVIFYEDGITKICSFPSNVCLVALKGTSASHYSKDLGGNFTLVCPENSCKADFFGGVTPVTFSRISYACLSRSGNRLILGSQVNKTITFMNPHTGEKIFESALGKKSSLIPLRALEDGFNIVEFDSTGNRALMLTRRGDLFCIDLSESKLLLSMHSVNFAKINSSGKRLFIVRGTESFMWDVDASHEIRAVFHRGPLASFCNDGAFLVTSDGSKLYFWDSETAEPVSEEPLDSLAVDSNDLRFMEFSPSGNIIVVAYFSQAPKVFHVQTGTLLCTLPDSFTQLGKVSFGTRDDRFIGMLHGKVYVWNIGCPIRLLNAFLREESFTLPQRVILSLLVPKIDSHETRADKVFLDFIRSTNLKQSDYEALLEKQAHDKVCFESDRKEFFRILDDLVIKSPLHQHELESYSAFDKSQGMITPPSLNQSPVRLISPKLVMSGKSSNLSDSPVRFTPTIFSKELTK